MADDTARLAVLIEANTRSYERALKKLEGNTERSMKRVSRSAEASARAFRRLGGALAAAFSINQARRFSDAFTRIENSLKVAGVSGDNLVDVYQALEASALRNFAPLESLVELYSRAALVQKELNISSAELLGFTDKIALALRVSGRSASETSGALLQLSQALGSGIVRAEEFNSILEGALPIAQAAAAGLEEAGGSVAKLRQLVVDGQVSSEAFFRAFEAGAVTLETKVASAVATSDQALENLKTTFIGLAGSINQATGFSQLFVSALNKVSEAAQFVKNAFDRMNGSIGAYEQLSLEALNANKEALLDIIRTTEEAAAGDGALDKFYQMFGDSEGTLEKARSDLVEIERQIKRVIQASVGGGEVPQGETVQPVSLKQFEVSPQAIKSVQQLTDKWKDLREVTDDVGDNTHEITDMFGETLIDIITGTQNASDAMRNFAREIQRAALQALLLGKGPLANLFGNNSSGGGLLGSLFGGILGRAGGGGMSKDKPYWVGERGKELFIPHTAGKVVNPGNAGGGGSSSGGNVILNIDNQAGTQFEQQGERRGPNNSRLIDVVNRPVKDLFGSGEMDGTMSQRYGFGRQARVS